MATAAHFLQAPATEMHFTTQQSWEENLLRTYPELLHLADDRAVNTQEGFASHEPSPSTRLFGQKYIEFDRTLLTIRCLDMILAGKYEEFIAGQDPNDQLTRESFFELKSRAERLLVDLQISKEVMIAALVLGDMGKCPGIRRECPEITEPDHDDFEREWLKILWDNPERCETYQGLQLRERQLIGNAAGLAHFGHIFHQEGGPEMFAHLASQKRNLDVRVLDFALFIQCCDVAGAAGHVKPFSSLAFTQKVYDGYMAVANACHAALKKDATAESIYQAALRTRGALCGFKEDEVLAIRLAAMMRLTTVEEGAWLKEALNEMPEQYTRPLPCPPLTATYMPAVLVNKMGETQGGPRDKIRKAVEWGLPLLQEALALKCPEGVRHCFNQLAAQAKAHAEGAVAIDSEGNVSLKRGE